MGPQATTQATTPAGTGQPRPDRCFDDWLKRAIQQAFGAAQAAGPPRLAS